MKISQLLPILAALLGGSVADAKAVFAHFMVSPTKQILLSLSWV
jgi:hypothetical protein